MCGLPTAIAKHCTQDISTMGPPRVLFLSTCARGSATRRAKAARTSARAGWKLSPAGEVGVIAVASLKVVASHPMVEQEMILVSAPEPRLASYRWHNAN